MTDNIPTSTPDDAVNNDDILSRLTNWDLPNEPPKVWSVMDDGHYRKSLLAALQKSLDDCILPSNVCTTAPVLDAILDNSVHPFTILDTINNAGKILFSARDGEVDKLLKVAACEWLRADHLTKTLLALVCQPDSPRKMANMKNFYGILFTAGEKFFDADQFIGCLLEKVDLTMRILVAKESCQTLVDFHPRSLANIIDRIFVRYYAVGKHLEGKPFKTFMLNLLELCQVNFRAQRLIANVLLLLTPPIQDKILVLWFKAVSSTRIPGKVLFYPFSSFMANQSYKKALLETIPFSIEANENVVFWKNWSAYVTSEPQLIPVVWETFTGSLWKVAATTTCGERLINPAFAFASLSLAIKPRISDIPLELIMNGPVALESMAHLMASVDLQTMHIAWAITHILFELSRVHQNQATGTNPPIEPFIDPDVEASQIFLQIVAVYEDKSPEDVRIAELCKPSENDQPNSESKASTNQVHSDLDDDEDDGQEKFDECLDDRVRRLRAAGRIPTSMLDVYLILSGDTLGSNDAETEILKQVAVLNIPILLNAGLLADPTQVEYISRILLEWEETDEMEDFIIVSLAEIGKLYPEIVSVTLEKLLFGRGHSMGDKGRMLRITENALILLGTGRCISCYSTYTPAKKEAINKFINRLEPAYFPRYLHIDRTQVLCITCPPSSKQEGIESNVCITNQISAQQISPQAPQRPLPVTRRWGRKRNEQQTAEISKKSLHTFLWPIIRNHLTQDSASYTNNADQIKTHFLIQLLEFSKLLFITYSGLNCHMDSAARDVVNLVHIYKDHPNRQFRRALLDVVKGAVTNPCIYRPSSPLDSCGYDSLGQISTAMENDEELISLHSLCQL